LQLLFLLETYLPLPVNVDVGVQLHPSH